MYVKIYFTDIDKQPNAPQRHNDIGHTPSPFLPARMDISFADDNCNLNSTHDESSVLSESNNKGNDCFDVCSEYTQSKFIFILTVIEFHHLECMKNLKVVFYIHFFSTKKQGLIYTFK